MIQVQLSTLTPTNLYFGLLIVSIKNAILSLRLKNETKPSFQIKTVQIVQLCLQGITLIPTLRVIH